MGSGDLPGLQSRRFFPSRVEWWIRLPHASANRGSPQLAAYRAPNETSVLVAVTFLRCFQTDNIDEVVERLNHRGISLVEGGDLFSGNGLVRGKGLARIPVYHARVKRVLNGSFAAPIIWAT
jgi:hypothetical protein